MTIDRLQTCRRCLERHAVQNGTMCGPLLCRSDTCDDCNGLVQRWLQAKAQTGSTPGRPACCSACRKRGHTSALPALRACDACLDSNSRCERLAVLGITFDCASIQWAVMRLLMGALDSGRALSRYALVLPFPDPTHDLKNILQGPTSWILRSQTVAFNSTHVPRRL